MCNPCGDKFLAGTLGELKAPGSAFEGENVVKDSPDDTVTEDLHREKNREVEAEMNAHTLSTPGQISNPGERGNPASMRIVSKSEGQGSSPRSKNQVLNSEPFIEILNPGSITLPKSVVQPPDVISVAAPDGQDIAGSPRRGASEGQEG